WPLSVGLLICRAFWITRRNAGFEFGSDPPAFTATLISLLMRENCLDMRSQRPHIVCLRTSKILPMRQFSQQRRGVRNDARRRPSAGTVEGIAFSSGDYAADAVARRGNATG